MQSTSGVEVKLRGKNDLLLLCPKTTRHRAN